MAKKVSVSFENEIVKVVYASPSSEGVTVESHITMKDEEFDEFLKTEKTRRFTVTANFKRTYQDIITLPPVKDKILSKLVELDIKKKAPDLGEISFYYSVLNDMIEEGRKVISVFVYAVSGEELSQVFGRFSKYGKIVNDLYPDSLLLSCLSTAGEKTANEANVYVSESGSIKNILLAENGKVYFMRSFQSSESGINDADVQNINMTLNYCRQTLRKNPVAVTFMGTAAYKYSANIALAAPPCCSTHSINSNLSSEKCAEYLAPIAALMPLADLAKYSFLPEDTKAVRLQKMIMLYSSCALIVISLAGGAYLNKLSSERKQVQDNITALRSEIAQMGSVTAGYKARFDELQKVMPRIQFINDINSSPDMKKTLIALSEIAPAKLNLPTVSFGSIQIEREAKNVKLIIKGNIKSFTYIDLETTYAKLLDALKGKGLEVISKNMSIQEKTFQVEARMVASPAAGGAVK
ncbi:MAG: hypothetical protein EPN22_14395 [Nitrospirae bacterium]|nr:MAG: hypothetical protein EPN22_14395 [Nitrospirota bacterium]